MKICFFVSQLYKAGGIEKTVYNRLDELSKKHDIYLITMENGDNPFYFGNFNNVNHFDINAKFNRYSNGAFRKNFYNIIISLVSLIKMQFLLFRIKPDISINVIGSHSFYFLPFLFFKGITVLEHHSSFYQEKPEKIRKNIMKKYDYHIFLTHEEASLINFVKNKIIIPNPVKLESTIIPYHVRKNRVIAAGRIVDIKGFDRLIKSWSIIQQKHSDWVLEIYGDSDKNVYKKLNRMINELNLKNKVFLKSSTPDIVDLISDSKIYAMTSHFECFPMVLLEAMSKGVVIISFDCPTGPRNIVNNNDNGFLVINNDIECFAKKMEEVILDEKMAILISKNAYRDAYNFDLKVIVSKWNDFFNNAIQ